MDNWTNDSCLGNCSLQPDEEYLQLRDNSRYIVQKILIPIITIIGVIGNSVTIIIMSRRRMRSSTNHYLAALAVVDMLYLIFSIVLSLPHYESLNIHDIKYYLYWRFRPFIIMLTDTSSNTSVWLTVSFTVERYIAVCHPMKGKVFCTESRAKKVIIGVFLICSTLTLPTPFEYKIDESDRTRISLAPSDLGKNLIYRSTFYWLTTIIFIIAPLMLLAIFNSFLIRSLHLSKARRKSMTRRADSKDSFRQERKITIMLVSVVILFFVCQLPTAIVLIYQTINEITENTNEAVLFITLGNIFNCLMAINAAGNFVLYCLFSKKYRATFVQTFCPCLKGKIFHLHSVIQTTLYSASGSTRRISQNISMTKIENGQSTAGKEINLKDYSGSWKVVSSPKVSFCCDKSLHENSCNV